MSVKPRLVVSTAAVIAVALSVLTAVIATLTGNQAQADGERYRRRPGQVRGDGGRRRDRRAKGSATSLSRVLGTAVAAGRGDRALADLTERDMLPPTRPSSASGRASSPMSSTDVDAVYVGTPTTDATGRYVSYWFRDGDKISVTPLTGYETPGPATTTCSRGTRARP